MARLRDKTLQVAMRMSDDELRLIKSRAAKADLSVSDYLRYAACIEAMYAGDMAAFKLVGAGVRDLVIERVQAMMQQKLFA